MGLVLIPIGMYKAIIDNDMNYKCGGFCLLVIVKHVIMDLSVVGRCMHEVRKRFFENITAYY